MIKNIKNKFSKGYKILVLIIYYIKKLEFSVSKKKQIIICFDGNFPHGGLVDRLKGIVSFYEISKILNYDFKIMFNHPFKLEEFLSPNLIDWLLADEAIKYNFLSTKVLYLMNDFERNPLEIINKTKANTIIVYSNIDYLSVLYPQKNRNELDQIWRNNYFELFKTSNYLNEILKNNPKVNRRVFHIRFTTLLGDFSDSTKKVLKDDEKYDLIEKVITRIDSIVDTISDRVIYVLSDSQLFLNYIEKNTKYKILEGTPKHLENSSPVLEFHAKTFSDFYFLIESEEIYLIKIGEMYNSSFSRYAAVIGNKNFITLT